MKKSPYVHQLILFHLAEEAVLVLLLLHLRALSRLGLRVPEQSTP